MHAVTPLILASLSVIGTPPAAAFTTKPNLDQWLWNTTLSTATPVPSMQAYRPTVGGSSLVASTDEDSRATRRYSATSKYADPFTRPSSQQHPDSEKTDDGRASLGVTPLGGSQESNRYPQASQDTPFTTTTMSSEGTTAAWSLSDSTAVALATATAAPADFWSQSVPTQQSGLTITIILGDPLQTTSPSSPVSITSSVIRQQPSAITPSDAASNPSRIDSRPGPPPSTSKSITAIIAISVVCVTLSLGGIMILVARWYKLRREIETTGSRGSTLSSPDGTRVRQLS